MKIKVWDIEVRIFHWLLVVCYGAAFFTSRTERLLEYHTVAGYAALGLVVFRVLWGFAGSRHARFSDFVKGYREVKGFLRDAVRLRMERYIGHNPAVGWAVVFILSTTAALAITGMTVYGGEEGRGILAGVAGFEAAAYAREAHEALAYLAVAFIVVHISAALLHDFVLRENIILSMITGDKEDDGSWRQRTSAMGPAEGRSVPRLIVWLIAVLMGGAGLVYLPPEGRRDISRVAEPKVMDERGVLVELAPSPAFKAECSPCHNIFHPTLLPEASWRKVMGGLDDHFGDSVPLDEKTRGEILAYLAASSAERSATEASKKILRSIKGEPPMRVTDTPYWRSKHSGIKEEIFKRKSVASRSNCIACHPGAEKGSFEDRDIHIPL